MARFLDKVGFAPAGTFVDGVWSANIIEREYKGYVLEQTRSLEPADKVEDDFRLQNRIRIICDAFALENFINLRYVWWQGNCWVANTVVLERPELTISLGGIYHGDFPED